VALTRESAPSSRRRALRDILLYGLCGGLLIAVLKLTEYRFLVVAHSVEIYVAPVAALFAGLGVWLELTLTRKKPALVIKEIRCRPRVRLSLTRRASASSASPRASWRFLASSPPA
jgi:hypothetical protein